MDLSNVCRLCLVSDINNVDILSDADQKFEISLQTVVWKLFGFWIHPEDELPRRMCSSCIQRTYTYYLFSMKVKQIQLKIHEITTNKTAVVKEQFVSDNLSSDSSEKSKVSEVDNLHVLESAEQSPDSYETFPDMSASMPHVKDPRLFLNEETSHFNQVSSANICPLAESQNAVEIKVEVDPLIDDQSRNGSVEDCKDNTSKDHFPRKREIKTRSKTEKRNETDAKTQTSLHISNVNLKEGDNRSDTSCDSESNCEVQKPVKKLRIRNLVDRKKNWTERSKQRSKLTEQLAEFYNFTCLECDEERKFPTYHQLNVHSKKQHGLKGYVTCCNQKLQDKNVIKSHMMKHLSPGIFQCQECGKELANKESLENHLVKHMPEESRPFKCSECGRGFPSKGGLTAHEKSHLPEDERLRYVCDACGKRFPYQTSLNSHKKYVHLNLRTVMCHICPKTFVDKASLNSHIHTHLTNERVQCAECGKWFKNQINLRAHMKTHEGLIFSCPKCVKVFSTKHRLGEHVRSHTDARPHQCSICSRSFKVRAGLKTHMVQHTGEKPYQCPFCPRTFASSGNFSTHKKRMHGAQKLQMLPHYNSISELTLNMENGRN